MKLYKTKKGPVLEAGAKYFAVSSGWDELLNDADLYGKLESFSHNLPAGDISLLAELQAPIGRQELWACGVTYLRSKIGRQEESKDAGGGDFYARVYEAERPEVFYKCNAHRVSDPHGYVRIRKDSTWDVPEPELTLVVNSAGKIVGYTIGNDMSSRSIEGENPLYLPQAKTYDGCAALGPCIYVTRDPLSPDTQIRLEIRRNGSLAFEGNVALSQMKRTPQELVSFVFRECSFPQGCLVMTGTGIVPGNEFTLRSGDEVRIAIPPIGELVNTVQ